MTQYLCLRDPAADTLRCAGGRSGWRAPSGVVMMDEGVTSANEPKFHPVSLS